MNPLPNQETAENQQDRPPFLQFNSAMHVHDKRPSLADFEQLKFYTTVWIHIMFVSGTLGPFIIETSIMKTPRF